MEAKREIGITGILLGFVAALYLALCLAPGLAIAEDTSSGAAGSELQTAANKPSQAIQAAYLPSFTTDTGKNLSAKVVEGNGALSYAVKSGGDCVSVDSNGALTFSKAGKAIITVTAAATNEYAETSIDVPITIYDHFDYTFTVGNTLDCVDYYGHYPINKLEIKLKGWENVLGSGTINSPQRGSKTTIRATGFAKRIELKAEIQQRRNTRSASKTLDLNGGGRFEIEMNSRGTIVMCDYGITLPEPDYVAPVAKPNLSSTGQNQLLIYPGSVLSGGQHMEYTFGTATEPNQNGWTDNYGFMRAKDPGDYYVWWKTASRDRRSLMYFSGGRLDTAPQCMKVTIGKGSINPTVSIGGWTYGEEPKAPTVTGNTGNGAVTYEYKAKGADDSTYSTTVPKDAGDYTVRAKIAETTTHSGGTATADFTIAKADMSNQNIRVAGVMGSHDTAQAWVGNFTQSLKDMVPADAGTVTYTADTPTYKDGATEAPDGVQFTSEVSSNGEFSATLTIDKGATAIPDGAQEITVPVTVTCEKNYKNSTINIVLVPKERTLVTVSLSAPPESVAYGDDDFTLTATVKDGDDVVQTKDGDWYWYSSDPNVLEVPEVTSGYSVSSTMTVKVKSPGSAMILAWYEPTYAPGYEDTQYIGAALTESITVNKAEFTPTATIVGWTYGAYNEQANAPSVSGIPEGASKEIQESSELKVTYEYKAKDAADSTYTATVPTLAGTYTVRATVPETANYKSAACTADFSIAKKKVTATVTAVDKTYDGTTDATVSATVSKDDLVQSDLDDAALVEDGKVAMSGLSGSFEDKNVGENKEVVLNYDNVTSPVANAECYEVTATTETPTAAITPRPVYVGTADKSSPYGEPLAELAYGPYGPTTLVEGDTLASLGVTASTKASETSAVGEYPITLSGGTGNPNYEVTLGEDATYTITAADISRATVELAERSYTYDGKAKEPAVKVTVGGRELVAGTDYDVSYKDNVGIGTATVTVTGKGNYTSTASATFAIERPIYKNVEGGGASWAKGTTTGLKFTFKRSADDEKTFSQFVSINVDGVDVPRSEYDAVSGSVVVTLKPAFLEGLSAGEHTLTALFDDADPAEATFTVTDAATPKDSGKDADAGTGANTNGGANGGTNANAAAIPSASRATPTAAASGTSLARTADPLRPEVPAALALAAAAAAAAGLLARRKDC